MFQLQKEIMILSIIIITKTLRFTKILLQNIGDII